MAEGIDHRDQYQPISLTGSGNLPHCVARLVPPRFQGWRMADLDNTPARQQVRQYAAGFKQQSGRGKGLLIVGGTGTGKTTIAAALMIELALSRCRDSEFFEFQPQLVGFKFVTAHDLLEAAKDFKNKSLDKYKQASFLVIDDLGADRLTDYGAGELLALLDYRYRELKPTVITTNLSRADMIAYLGERAVSRLDECTDKIVLAGADRRKQKGA